MSGEGSDRPGPGREAGLTKVIRHRIANWDDFRSE